MTFILNQDENFIFAEHIVVIFYIHHTIDDDKFSHFPCESYFRIKHFEVF